MVSYVPTTSGFDVVINEKRIGHLMKGVGFFVSSLLNVGYTEVSSEDLAEIALKAKEVKIYGNAIPVCGCGGTPDFPRMIYASNEGLIPCQATMHPLGAR